MNFPDFHGNLELKAHLSETIDRGAFSHAYLIWGLNASGASTASGKVKLSWILASALLCTGLNKPCGYCADCKKTTRHIHPDITEITRQQDKREIYVAQIREITAEAYVLPNEASRKVYIIHEADTMNISAQNAILKVLEEPPSFVTFILEATNPGSFLETLRSRCIEIQISPDSPSSGSPAEDDALPFRTEAEAFISALLEADPLLLFRESLKLEKLDRQQLMEYINALYAMTAAALKRVYGNSRNYDISCLLTLLNTLESVRTMIRFNVSSGHIAGMLTAKLNSLVLKPAVDV